MRIRQLLAAGVAAASIAVGCVAASGGPVLAGNSVERPFKSTATGTIFSEDLADCDLGFLGTGEPFLECDQVIVTASNTTHLGLTSNSADGVLTIYFTRGCLTPGGFPGVEYESTGQTTFTAANGDTLTATTSVTGCGDGVNLTEPQGSYSITGGTGRFAGATGNGDVSSSTTGTAFASTWTGTISY